ATRPWEACATYGRTAPAGALNVSGWRPSMTSLDVGGLSNHELPPRPAGLRLLPTRIRLDAQNYRSCLLA
ncbi:MAG: hypothetical protein ACKPKO_60940, partial [Candidatus Fonsibacter sp.]